MHLLIGCHGYHMNFGEVSETASRMINEPYDWIILPVDCSLEGWYRGTMVRS